MRASNLFKVETEKEDISEYSAVFAEKLKGWESKTDKIIIGHFNEYNFLFCQTTKIQSPKNPFINQNQSFF